MCIAAPAQIVEIKDNIAVVDFGGVRQQAKLDLVEDVEIGKYVLIHSGYAIEVLTDGIKKTVGRIREVLEFETKDADVDILFGTANVEKDLVLVDGEEYEYDKLIVATGSRPFIPPIKGSNYAKTYQDILNFAEIPKNLIIVGSGIMAAEFAGIFSALGSNVEILSRSEFLRMLDDDIKKYVVGNLLDDVGIHKNIKIKEIHEDGVSTNKGRFDGLVLLTTGMTPNSEIVHDIVDIGNKGEILVNNKMETSNKNIYAGGDVIGGIGTTPIARMEGIVAARNACGIVAEADYRFIPQAISLYHDVSFLSFEDFREKKPDNEEIVEGHIPGSAGPGSFWNVLDGKTGLTKTAVDIETGDIKKLISVSPSARTTMAYMSKLLRDGNKTYDFDNFMETHPSTDAVYKLMRFFAKFS